MGHRAAGRAQRFAAAASLTMVAIILSPGIARACSCAYGEPRDRLAEADAAFIGTLLDRDAGLFSQRATFTFEVEHDMKGNLDERVEVVADIQGSSCGIDFEEGARAAMFLFLEGAQWTSSLCSQVDPDELLAAAEPLPAPTGRGPVRFVVGGNFGEARVLALDRGGRTLAYGWGAGDVYDLDVCPGGRRMVESVRDERDGSLVIRDVATLSIIRTVRIAETKFPSISAVACLDESAEHLAAVDQVGREIRIHDVRAREDRIVFTARGRSWGAEIDDETVYLTTQKVFGRVELESGRFTSIATIGPGMSSPRLSPDGSWVAVVRYGGSRQGRPPSDILLLPTDGGQRESLPLVFWNDGGALEWLADDRLLFLPAGEDVDRLAVYSVPSMTEIVGTDGWQTHEQIRDGDVVYGLGWQGLVRARLGTDDETTLIRRIGGEPYALDLVPGAVEAEPRPAPPAEPVVNAPSVASGGRLVIVGVWAIAFAAVLALARMTLRRRRP